MSIDLHRVKDMIPRPLEVTKANKDNHKGGR